MLVRIPWISRLDSILLHLIHLLIALSHQFNSYNFINLFFLRDKHHSDMLKYVLLVLTHFVSKPNLTSMKWVIGYSVARTSIARPHSNQRHIT